MLTRADMKAGLLQKMLINAGHGAEVLSEARLRASLGRALTRHPKGDVWLFAYGSLVWNPMIEVAERRIGTVRGLQRSFCLRLVLGRGSPECPGLMLALDRGGSVEGAAYRVRGAIVRRELELLWRREMVTGAYVPTWVKVRCGHSVVEALAFVINRRHPGYVGALPVDTVARAIATARGQIGSCAEYFHSTVDGLAAVGIRDKRLDRLAALLRRGTYA